MTEGWFFSPPLHGTLSLLILRSSASSLGCLCSKFLPAHLMRLSCLLLWMSFENFSMLSLMVRSVPLPSGLVPCLPRTTFLPRSSSTISGLWLGTVISYWRGHSLFMPSVCACKHIMGVILKACDENNTGLPFGCLLTQIILQPDVSVIGELKMKIQDPISKQTLMKSNA